ncbi:MAG: glycosyltransferase family 1 protein, partial [Candidatus Hydrogenedentes bacterium]|nr:glycosyltransferase family 1 protein [Candidatus Hydrogenedentota bacterium]
TRQADLVFVGSENMLQKRAGLNPEMHVVYHAADFAHFSRAASPNTAVPQDLAGLPRPVIGAIGVLDAQRFDAELVAAPPQARPAWSFALVGPARPGLDLLQ